ncbi:MAG: 4Fe-4S binding protein [Spirochaetes bacterium]|nr:4Fe-4S binding protein [Spirochaetota bacterium]
MKISRGKRSAWVRRGVQVTFFLFVFTVVFSHFVERRGLDVPWPVVGNFHAICPFGAVETAGRLLFEGSFIPKIHESNLWTFAGVALLTLLFGPLFCGWLCPLGSVQEWIGGIGKRIFKKRYNRFIGEKADRMLGYMRYGVLALILYFTTHSISLVFQRYDPYYALFHFWTGDVFFTALVVLGFVILLSFFFERPWCRWLCPFGALLGILQLVSPWKIRRNREECTGCGVCKNRCPMRIPLDKKGVVRDTRCNRCLECVTSCRREGALEYSAGGGGILPFRNKALAGLLAVAVFAAPILFSRAVGLYNTTGSGASEARKVQKGMLAVEEIKGSMSLEDVAAGMNIDVGVLNAILGLPADIPASTKLYDLEEIDGSLTLAAVKTKIADTGEPDLAL